MDNLLIVIAALSVPVASLMEVLKQVVLKRLQARYSWTDQTYIGVVTLTSVLVSYAVLGGMMLMGTAFPLLPAIGLNADIPILSWLMGGLALALANQVTHEGLNAGKALAALLRNYADLLGARAEAYKAAPVKPS